MVNRRDLIKRGLALTAWLATRQAAAAEASSNAFARFKAAVSGQAATQTKIRAGGSIGKKRS